jgi:hypothetical protein
MRPFDLDLLIFPAATIFVATLVLSLFFTRDFLASLLLSLLKSAIFAVYFGLMFDGTYTSFDDWHYLAGGKELLLNGVGLQNLAQNWDEVTQVAGGSHFVYYLYNAYAIQAFGDAYFAPVALNVVLTTVIAIFGTALARVEFGINQRQSTWLYALLLMHPDVLAWSSVFNGKDILVLLAHVLLLLAISLLFRGRLLTALLLALPTALMLEFLRFYVLPLFTLALASSVLLSNVRFPIKYCLMWACIAAALFPVATSTFSPGINIGWLQGSFPNPVSGFVRTLLTPIPFNTEVSYGFLNAPALIHWILMPFVALGLVRVWRIRTLFSRVFLAYLLVFVCFYSLTEELQGPRHRVQLCYALALLQFIGVLSAQRLFMAPHSARERLQLTGVPHPVSETS